MVFMNHETRNTKHESRNTAFSPWVRMGGATGNRRLDHCACRQVTASRFTVVHYCSPENIVRSQCPCPFSRSRSAPRRAPLSELLPLRRTQYEPMLRKGNILFFIDMRISTRTSRRLAEVRVWGLGPARYSANRERANLLHSGGGKKVTRPVSIMGAVPMESAEAHRARACVRKIFKEAEAKRVVRPDGSGIRFPRSTSS